LFALMQELNFEYVIWLGGNIQVTDAKEKTADTQDWVGAGGRVRTLRNATVTEQHFPVPTVVCLQAKEQSLGFLLDGSFPLAHLRRMDAVLTTNLVDRLSPSKRIKAYLRLELRRVDLPFFYCANRSHSS